MGKKIKGRFKSNYFTCDYEIDEDLKDILEKFLQKADEYFESRLNIRCSMCESPIDRDLALSDGFGDLSITFGYGSQHDSEIYSGILCDNCFEKLAKKIVLKKRDV